MLKALIEALLFIWYVTPPIIRHSRGRWYVFRNCPEWVLEELAEVVEDEADAITSSFLREAREELHRRRTWKKE